MTLKDERTDFALSVLLHPMLGEIHERSLLVKHTLCTAYRTWLYTTKSVVRCANRSEIVIAPCDHIHCDPTFFALDVDHCAFATVLLARPSVPVILINGAMCFERCHPIGGYDHSAGRAPNGELSPNMSLRSW